MKVYQSAMLCLFTLAHVKSSTTPISDEQRLAMCNILCPLYACVIELCPEHDVPEPEEEYEDPVAKPGDGVAREGSVPTRKLALSDEALQACAEFDYTVSAGVLFSHVILFAEPRCDAGPLRNDQGCEKCGNFIIHSPEVRVDGEHFLEKEIVAVPEEAPEFERSPLGTVPLGKLIEAFDNTQVDASPYSWLKNNCGSFLIALTKNVGIPPTKDVVNFVSRKLYENAGSFIVEKISGSETRGDETEDVVIEDFVTEYIHTRL